MILDTLKSSFPDAIEKSGNLKDKPFVQIKKEKLVDVCRYLFDQEFKHLSCITGIDYMENFEVVYNLWSYPRREHIVLKVVLDHNNPKIPSLTSIWKGADWLERETYDLVGIVFEGHPNLKRIFLPEGWEGHPLRKDYPLKGPEKEWAGFLEVLDRAKRFREFEWHE